MSFPYRVLDYFLENELVVMVILRFFSIAMVLGGIILFRRLLLRVGISKRITHFSIALFVAMPIVPLLAAQSNYDNLLFLITPIFLTYSYNLIQSKPTVQNLLAFGISGMLATLVKHNFVVVFLAVTAYICVELIRKYRGGVGRVLIKSLQSASRVTLALTAILFIVVTGLFIERHGANVLRYGQIKVDCARVQPDSVCEQYSPWRRNRAAIEKNLIAEDRYSNPLSFSVHWVTTIMRAYNAVFANIAPEDVNQPDPYGHYVFKALLPLPITVTYTIFFAGSLAVVLKIKYIWRNKFLRLSLLAFVALAGALWLFNYTFYLKHGRAYAVQARYLLPLTILLFVVFVSSWQQLLRKRYFLQQSLAVGIVAILLYSGGITGWIIRSEPNWYLPSSTALQMNTSAKSVLKKVIWH